MTQSSPINWTKLLAKAVPHQGVRTLSLVALLCTAAPLYAQDTPEEPEAAQPETSSEDQDADAPEGQAQGPGSEAPAPGDKKEPPKTEEATGPEITSGMNSAQRDAINAYRQAYTVYKAESADYQSTVDDIVEAKYRQRVAGINSDYNKEINAKTLVERARRIQAIAAFEKFVERYPRNAKFTPDALFRLAELYFEKANDEYLLADEAFQTQLAEYESGKLADRPAEPSRSYAQTIKVFEQLIRDWPQYRLLDGAYYLLAYSEQQQGNYERARDLFLTLIANRPDSEFVPEAWIRVGEFFFDEDELDKARQAYSEAMKFPKSRFYDKALYKLAWTHYRQDNFDEAIKNFRTLIEFSDAKEAKTGKSGSVLRAEAVQYMAISLAEEDWDLDGIKDDAFGLERTKQYLPGSKAYEREVLAQLAEYLFENKRFDQSIDIIRFALEAYPVHPENPQLHEQLVLALFRNDNLNAAFAERRNLGTVYGPTSPWHEEQKKQGNVDAMRYASNLVRDNLIQSATWFHEQAQKQRDEALANQSESSMQEAQVKYALAAKTYAEFIKKHPNDKDAFQWSFYLAECLFYSAQYLPAYDQYRAVRELDIRDKEFLEIQQTSAFNTVKALELKMGDLIAAGQLPASVLPNGATPPPAEPEPEAAAEAGGDDLGVQRVKPKDVPPIVSKYILAMDRFIVLDFKTDDPLLNPKMAFQSAKILYDYNQYDQARKRFEWLIKNHNTSAGEKEVAALAATLWLETYRVERDYDNLSTLAKRLKGQVDVTSINEEIRTYEMAGLFKAAQTADKEKRYEEAIEKYLELVSRDKDKTYTVKALNNAAVASESVQKYDQAVRLYERVYREFPQDPLASYALYRIAVNAEQFFEFDKAIQNYLAFHRKYANEQTPKALGAVGFSYKEKAATALKNAAILLDDLQQYEKAAGRYKEFYTSYPTDKDAEATAWRSVLARKKSKDNREMIRAVEDYESRFGSSATAKRVLEGLSFVADYYQERNDERNATKWYNRILDAYVKYGVQPGTDAAFYAAKAQFMLTEFEFAQWNKIAIRGNQKKQKKLLDARIKGQQALTPKYQKVYAYQNLEWSMAAGFREGNLFQEFAKALYNASVPFKEGSEEWDIYRGQLDDIAVPLEDEAVKKYELIVKKAREAKIVNDWTKRALEELNKYKPQDYPLFKEEREHIEERDLSGLPMLDAAGYKSMTNPTVKKEEGQ